MLPFWLFFTSATLISLCTPHHACSLNRTSSPSNCGDRRRNAYAGTHIGGLPYDWAPPTAPTTEDSILCMFETAVSSGLSSNSDLKAPSHAPRYKADRSWCLQIRLQSGIKIYCHSFDVLAVFPAFFPRQLVILSQGSNSST